MLWSEFLSQGKSKAWSRFWSKLPKFSTHIHLQGEQGQLSTLCTALTGVCFHQNTTKLRELGVRWFHKEWTQTALTLGKMGKFLVSYLGFSCPVTMASALSNGKCPAAIKIVLWQTQFDCLMDSLKLNTPRSLTFNTQILFFCNYVF